jgi:hypothetical protein
MNDQELHNVRMDVGRAMARANAAAEPAIRATLAAELPMARLPFDLRSEGGTWDDMQGAAKLWLLPSNRLKDVPDGTPLVSIMRKVYIVGLDDIDTDTRGGWLAVGLLDSQIGEPL